MEMKIVIPVEGWSDRGKSCSLLRLVEGLALDVLERDKADCLAVGMYRGLRVGVSTQGDPNSCMGQWIDRLLGDEHCEVVFAACRPTQTYPVIGEAAKRNGYKQVKVTTSLNVMECSNTIDGVDLNEVDATRFRMMLDSFADSKISASKGETTGEDAL